MKKLVGFFLCFICAILLVGCKDEEPKKAVIWEKSYSYSNVKEHDYSKDIYNAVTVSDWLNNNISNIEWSEVKINNTTTAITETFTTADEVYAYLNNCADEYYKTTFTNKDIVVSAESGSQLIFNNTFYVMEKLNGDYNFTLKNGFNEVVGMITFNTSGSDINSVDMQFYNSNLLSYQVELHFGDMIQGTYQVYTFFYQPEFKIKGE